MSNYVHVHERKKKKLLKNKFSYKHPCTVHFGICVLKVIFRNNHKSMVKPPGQFIALQAINALKGIISR